MKIVPFPRAEHEAGARSPETEIESALCGSGTGAQADAWRELREDVRALATPMSPAFERALRARVEQAGVPRARRALPRPRLRGTSARARAKRVGAWIGSGLRPRLLAGSGLCALAAIVALVIVAPWHGPSGPRAVAEDAQSSAKAGRSQEFFKPGGQPHTSSARPGASSGAEAPAASQRLRPLARPVTQAATAAAAGGAAAQGVEPFVGGYGSNGAAGTNGRVQQRSATITLAATPDGVQRLADQVAALTVHDGGVVQSSQVRLQSGTPGEASLDLSIPSARLSAALASLAQLAPTRAESQSLQDITGEYDGAQRKLADIAAERQALLRALTRATTQGQIESLRARLSLVGGAISQARTKLQAVSRRGSSSVLEVSVLGDAHAGGNGLTLSNGVDDAGEVLRTALAALIVALAVLVPLAILLGLLTLAWRGSRRRLRERALS